MFAALRGLGDDAWASEGASTTFVVRTAARHLRKSHPDWRAALAPGSHLVISHGTAETRPEEGQEATRLYRAANDQLSWRSRARLAELVEGWELAEPGLVWMTEWRPDDPREAREDPSWSDMAALVDRKP